MKDHGCDDSDGPLLERPEKGRTLCLFWSRYGKANRVILSSTKMSPAAASPCNLFRSRDSNAAMRDSVRTSALLVATLCAWTSAPQAFARNHLTGQNSAYLNRAAGQPVDWYPWGAEAFNRAKELDRPILLDVGAIWCPWCGLMDRDTYTNPKTADYINHTSLP